MPIGSRQTILEMTVQRLECKDCGAVQQENIHFVRGKERYTYRMKQFVLDLCRIEAVASDFSEAFISAVREHLPDAVQVYDHFHIVKLMNVKLDKVRRATYNKETDENNRRLIKGQRWLLLAGRRQLIPESRRTPV